MLKHQLHSIFLILLATAILALGCIKEYSYEGQNTPLPVNDTLHQTPPAADFLSCNDCVGRDRFEDWRWSFKVGDSLFCGIIDTALINIERTAFTFFGPSACSNEIHMIITAYLEPTVLNKSYQDLLIPNITFYFNQWGAAHHLLVSRWGTPFSVKIDNYDHQTKVATGTFTGHAYKPDGTTALVHSAKFRIKLM